MCMISKLSIVSNIATALVCPVSSVMIPVIQIMACKVRALNLGMKETEV